MAERVALPAAPETFPDEPAVFAVHLRDGLPYVGRSARLRRRLSRLLQPREGLSKRLYLGELAVEIEYQLTPSRLATSLTLYDFARRYHAEDYSALIKLRPTTVVRVLLNNPFPRTQVTTRLGTGGGIQFGPFRSRVAAERFEDAVLDLFQVRRCQENLEPSPEHPGCIYGEMMKCLRPCQEVVGEDEYKTEVHRLVHFLETSGESMLESIRGARERFSEELNFEEAQRQHQRLVKVEQVLRLRDDVAVNMSTLNGVAVLVSPVPAAVELRFLLQGVWLDAVEFSIAPDAMGEMIPMDRRLRELVQSFEVPRLTLKEKTEHLALFSRWVFSSWRDGEWISFPDLRSIPYRRLVRSISKAAGGFQVAQQ